MLNHYLSFALHISDEYYIRLTLSKFVFFYKKIIKKETGDQSDHLFREAFILSLFKPNFGTK